MLRDEGAAQGKKNVAHEKENWKEQGEKEHRKEQGENEGEVEKGPQGEEKEQAEAEEEELQAERERDITFLCGLVVCNGPMCFVVRLCHIHHFFISLAANEKNEEEKSTDENALLSFQRICFQDCGVSLSLLKSFFEGENRRWIELWIKQEKQRQTHHNPFLSLLCNGETDDDVYRVFHSHAQNQTGRKGAEERGQ